MRKKIASYFMIIVMILSSVWVTPIKSYGQTEAEISSAEDVRNTETDHGTLKKSETDSVDDEELSNTVERNAGTSLNNASSEESLTEGNSLEAEDSEKVLEQKTDSDVSTQEETIYSYNSTSTSGAVTLKVEWNEPVLGQDTTFHVSATGGSGAYKFRMDAPSYSDSNEYAYESVADPSRGEWLNYTDACSFQDYTFMMTASGTYNFRFYVMDTTAGVYYLRVSTYIQVSDENYPSIKTIVSSAVDQAKKETDGSDYGKALWLHDWLIQQLDYDNSLKWSSAESALTRKLGTCQAYESAYSQLLTAAGIENAETRDTYDGHTWNAMKLDGEWYQVDCTWDDTKDNFYNFDATHLYFGLTDELMALAHKGHNNIYTTAGYSTRSTSLADNYFVKNGAAKEWAQNYVDRIQKNLNAGKTEFTISADNASYPPSISGIQNGITAYAIQQMEWTATGKKITLEVSGGATEFVFHAVYSACEHKWDEGKIIKEPTYDQEGIKRYTCLYCSETKDENIEKLNKYIESVSYKTRVQDEGWQDWKKDGELSGTAGQSKQVEAIAIELRNSLIHGDIKYRTYTQNGGWQDWKSNGEISGSDDETTKIEAIAIELTDELSKSYDVYYRTHCQDYGWLGWAKNGEKAGSEGYSKRMEAIEIRLVKKGEKTPETGGESFVVNTSTNLVSYKTYVEGQGWTNDVTDGGQSGTVGESKKLEGISLRLSSGIDGIVQYRTYTENDGWEDWSENGEINGKPDGIRRLEAIQIRLTGKAAEKYDIYYRVHCQDYGWLGWAKNGEKAGSEGYSRRMEAIEIQLVTKGQSMSGDGTASFAVNSNFIHYRTYVEKQGWTDYVTDGRQSGTVGESKKLESISLRLSSDIDGSVQYRTYTENEGWEDWSENGEINGKPDGTRRLEAIQIRLTGKAAEKYDIYYRVHCQDYGWLGWAKNGEKAGSEGYSRRMEAIEIQLVTKGQSMSGDGTASFAVNPNFIHYRTYVEKQGWTNYVTDGRQSGTVGESKKLESISLRLSSGIDGSVQYRTYTENEGWEDWSENGEINGKPDGTRRLEAIQIRLTGKAAEKYDIYYRVHCQDYGWLGWAKNGEKAGSEGYSRRMEAIEVRLVAKGNVAPGNMNNCFYGK
ncbi:MAG TPA: hypothetical protein OIM52_12380 [Fusicatenibacter saccharivorans]|nr:hypothetical protein [Fusicatenibacter saccharivorans]